MDNKLKITSWALYDAANTIFATNVVSLYFPLWVTVQKGAPDVFYILPYYFSMVLALFVLPFFGVLCDSFKKYSFFLNVFTIVCITCTALIGLSNSLFAGIAFFIFANLFNQVSANIFYPALLPRISSSDRIPLVSGLGVGLGYIGTITGIFFVRFFIQGSNYKGAFFPTAALFLLFFLPSFLFIKDDEVKAMPASFSGVIKDQLQKLMATFHMLRNNKIALRFFCAFVLIINGINGVLLNIGVYANKVMGFSDSQIPLFVTISTVFAFFSAFIFGFIIKRLGEKKTFSLVLIGWVLIIFAVAFCYHKQLCWILGPLAGILLAGTWVSSRPLIIKLSSQERIGEFFGFTGLASILGTLLSPVLWLAAITIFGPLGLVKYRIAFSFLALLIFAGFILLQKVPERKIIE